jgi:hypothetical protein
MELRILKSGNRLRNGPNGLWCAPTTFTYNRYMVNQNDESRIRRGHVRVATFRREMGAGRSSITSRRLKKERTMMRSFVAREVSPPG